MDKLSSLMGQVPAADAALITNAVNRRYYTGLKSSAGTLVVLRGKSVLIIDSRYFELAQKCATVDEVVLQDNLEEQIVAVLHKNKVKTLALEADHVTLASYMKMKQHFKGFELLQGRELSAAINAQREVKTQEEIDCVKAAQKITDQTFDYIIGWIKAGMTEQEIALEMEFYSRKMGSEGPAFSFIVAAGANSSMPHAVPSHYQIQKGDMLTMDFGCIINGYHSDMTRTVAVGEPGEKQKEVYQTVLEAQLRAIEAVRAGVVCQEVDRAARDHINSTAYKNLFGHGLGHSLGLEVHENPRFSPGFQDILKAGSIMSVEPGIYIPGEFGVRIEDLVVATETGCENLTHSTKELIIL